MTMTAVIIGYISTALNVWGNLMLAQKNIGGWLVRLLTNIGFIVYAIQIEGGEPMALNHVLFFGINVYGFWKWRIDA